MKKTATKILSLVLVSLLLCLALASCGNSNNVKKDLCEPDCWLWDYESSVYTFFYFKEDGSVSIHAYYGTDPLNSEEGTYEIVDNQIKMSCANALNYKYEDGKLVLTTSNGGVLEATYFDD